jgi:para-nitrobenzyl esterase
VLAGDVSHVSADIAFYKGIPYAHPPVKTLRWQPPTLRDDPLGTASHPFPATKFGAECMQFLSGDTMVGDEDCLFLNVAAPTAAANGRKLPVLLWIHGGNYMTGSSSAPVRNLIDIYANDAFVKAAGNSVVVVSVNYRLNVFGFLAGAELQNRTTDGSVGNFGIQDQRLAMAWTKRYIGAFGGDGDDITIFGESAGGNSVINHLAQPASFGLYTKAIVESGAYSLGADPMSKKVTQYVAMERATNCTTVDCLVGLDQHHVIQASRHVGDFSPTVDGVSLVAPPVDLIRRGQYNNKVPVVMGSNRDEEGFFLAQSTEAPADLNSSQLRQLLAAQLPSHLQPKIDQILALYAPGGGAGSYPYPNDLGNFSQPWWTAMRIETDMVPGLGACGVRWLAASLVNGGTPAVYTYLFAHPGPIEFPPFSRVLAAHAAELAFVFSDTYLFDADSDRKEEFNLASNMSGYWASFAATGAPGHTELRYWPRYSPATDTLLRLDTATHGGVRLQTGLRKHACDFWEAHVAPPSDRP